MPLATKGVTVKDAEGDYNVYINALYSDAVQRETFNHEMRHIMNGDFYDDRPVAEKEEMNDRR